MLFLCDCKSLSDISQLSWNIIIIMKSIIDLVTCVGGGYYAGSNFVHFSDHAVGVLVFQHVYCY